MKRQGERNKNERRIKIQIEKELRNRAERGNLLSIMKRQGEKKRVREQDKFKAKCKEEKCKNLATNLFFCKRFIFILTKETSMKWKGKSLP